jgi:hypothetical protein
MPEVSEVEYIEIKDKKRHFSTFWLIAVLSICLMAVISLLVVFVYMKTEDKLKDAPVPLKEVKSINDCKDEACLRTFFEMNPSFDCASYSGLNDPCYSALASARHDITYCSQISDQVKRDSCFSTNTAVIEVSSNEA